MGNRSCPPPPAPTGAFLLPLSTTALPFPRRILYRSQVPLRGREVWAALEDMAWAPDNVRKWSTLALLALMGTALTAAINPGFSAIISQKGLDFGNCLSPFLPYPGGQGEHLLITSGAQPFKSGGWQAHSSAKETSFPLFYVGRN